VFDLAKIRRRSIVKNGNHRLLETGWQMQDVDVVAVRLSCRELAIFAIVSDIYISAETSLKVTRLKFNRNMQALPLSH
jgi:hypothetical protein